MSGGARLTCRRRVAHGCSISVIDSGREPICGSHYPTAFPPDSPSQPQPVAPTKAREGPSPSSRNLLDTLPYSTVLSFQHRYLYRISPHPLEATTAPRASQDRLSHLGTTLLDQQRPTQPASGARAPGAVVRFASSAQPFTQLFASPQSALGFLD